MCLKSNINRRNGRIMTAQFDATGTLVGKGTLCPVPVVKTMSAIDDPDAWGVRKCLRPTGSMSGIDGWSSGAGGQAYNTGAYRRLDVGVGFSPAG